MDREELYRKMREYSDVEQQILNGRLSPAAAANCGHAKEDTILLKWMNLFRRETISESTGRTGSV